VIAEDGEIALLLLLVPRQVYTLYQTAAAETFLRGAPSKKELSEASIIFFEEL
jgi:hypothetical protein